MVDDHVTIQVLSDEVLLHIFLSLRPHWPRYIRRPEHTFAGPRLTWEWHRLVHVCRRWRYLIFASQQCLGLGLVTSRVRPWTKLGLWPPLPVCIHYNLNIELPRWDVEEAIATLEQLRDRILEIRLTISDSLLEKSNVWMESFPLLEHLYLHSPVGREHPVTVLPSGFLGGPTLASRRLRCILLEKITVPTLPQLLSSCPGLMHLFLGNGVLAGDGFISPAVLTASLSTAARLESLHVHLPSDIFHEEQESTDSELPPPNLVVLPALTYFKSEGDGSIEYLVDLVSRIHAPLLERFCVRVPSQRARPLDIPQLSQFISRTERMSAMPIQTSIRVSLGKYYFRISHEFEIRGHFCFQLACDPASDSFQASHVDYIGGLCKQLTPLISDVERVSMEIKRTYPEQLPNESELRTIPLWLRLFRLFDGAQELALGGDFLLSKAHKTAKIGQEVLPALRILRFNIGGPVPRIIKSFVAERELTGRPITVIFRGRHGSESA